MRLDDIVPWQRSFEEYRMLVVISHWKAASNFNTHAPLLMTFSVVLKSRVIINISIGLRICIILIIL